MIYRHVDNETFVEEIRFTGEQTTYGHASYRLVNALPASETVSLDCVVNPA